MYVILNRLFKIIVCFCFKQMVRSCFFTIYVFVYRMTNIDLSNRAQVQVSGLGALSYCGWWVVLETYESICEASCKKVLNI